MCYNCNVSAFYYADDGIKLTLTLNDLKEILYIESMELNKWNLQTNNNNKSKIIKYTRNRKIYQTFLNEKNILMNNKKFIWNEKTNIVEFLGFDLNFNQNNYLLFHLKKKLFTFNNLRSNLYHRSILVNFMPIDIQTNYYKIVIKIAFIYGLKIININKSYYTKTTILGINLKSDSLSVRILLGLPKLSDFIIKLKLLIWYDIFKHNDNIFTYIIKCNYNELCKEYINN